MTSASIGGYRVERVRERPKDSKSMVGFGFLLKGTDRQRSKRGKREDVVRPDPADVGEWSSGRSYPAIIIRTKRKPRGAVESVRRKRKWLMRKSGCSFEPVVGKEEGIVKLTRCVCLFFCLSYSWAYSLLLTPARTTDRESERIGERREALFSLNLCACSLSLYLSLHTDCRVRNAQERGG